MTTEQEKNQNQEKYTSKELFFIDENENEVEKTEMLTPSGRFKLIIRYYSTKKGCWDYSRGTVYTLDGKEVCDIKRNYSNFHHSFVNKNNHEWLITGRSYMSQTIVNLDTGEIFEPVGDHHNGVAFCWSSVVLSSDEQTLLVTGCHWACPYEYKFFDFSDPSKGWSELEILEAGKPAYVDISNSDVGEPMIPTFGADNIVCCYQTSSFYLPLGKYEHDLDYYTELEQYFKEHAGEYDKPENWRTDVDQIIKLQRQGTKMVIVDRWISEVEQNRIQRRKQANEKFKQWEKEFTTTDALYLKYIELLKNPLLNVEKYESRGITYPGWCPDFKEKETRWCRRILDRDKTETASQLQPFTVDLEWAVKTGPIKLQIFKNGNVHEDKFFEHSAEGMEKAFQYAINLLTNCNI